MSTGTSPLSSSSIRLDMPQVQKDIAVIQRIVQNVETPYISSLYPAPSAPEPSSCWEVFVKGIKSCFGQIVSFFHRIHLWLKEAFFTPKEKETEETLFKGTVSKV